MKDPWELVRSGRSYDQHRLSTSKWLLPPGINPYVRHVPNPLLGGPVSKQTKEADEGKMLVVDQQKNKVRPGIFRHKPLAEADKVRPKKK